MCPWVRASRAGPTAEHFTSALYLAFASPFVFVARDSFDGGAPIGKWQATK